MFIGYCFHSFFLSTLANLGSPTSGEKLMTLTVISKIGVYDETKPDFLTEDQKLN